MKQRYPIIFFIFLFLGGGISAPGPVFTDTDYSKFISPLSKVQKAIAGKLDNYFTGLHNHRQFNGSILVAKAGKVIYQQTFGIADKNSREPITDTSMFQLASVSKVLTATAVLILHEREMLDISRPFGDYFPDFPYPAVTIRQLLNHRSGIPNYIHMLNDEILRPGHRMSNTEMYEHLVAKNSRQCLRPGSRFNYCNTNYALLALLIEKVSGKPYHKFMKEELFDPLGMKHTGTILDIDLSAPDVTRPYDERWRPIEFDASDYVLGDKSIYSTAYDLYIFSEAMYRNMVIRPETQELAYTPYSRDLKVCNYGYGWRMTNYRKPEKKEVFHNGWWHGYRSSFHRRLNDTLTVIMLSNQLNMATYQTQKIYDIIDNTVTTEVTGAEEIN